MQNEQMEEMKALLAEMAEFFKYDPPMTMQSFRAWSAERDELLRRAKAMLATVPEPKQEEAQ